MWGVALIQHFYSFLSVNIKKKNLQVFFSLIFDVLPSFNHITQILDFNLDLPLISLSLWNGVLHFFYLLSFY